MTAEKLHAMRLAEALHPTTAAHLRWYDRGGRKGVGTWIGGTTLEGRSIEPSFYPVGNERHGRAWGSSWREVVAGLRAYSASRRRAEATSEGLMLAALDAAAEGFDVRAPCAQLVAWIASDPSLDMPL